MLLSNPADGLPFSVAQITHIGLVRNNNEDAFGWFTTPAGELFVVADGVGGHEGGEVASELANSALKEFIQSQQGEPEGLLRQGILYADAKIMERAEHSPGLGGMGSTIVCLLIHENIAYYTHIGDSRLYYLHNGELEQLPKDHSYVQDLVDAGQITPEEAERHPERNVITQSLGGNVSGDCLEVFQQACYPGDIFMLCTDGLSGPVKADEIKGVLNQSSSPQEKVKHLLEKALKGGGLDNITAQIVAFSFNSKPINDVAKLKKRPYCSFLPFLCLFLGISLGILGTVVWPSWGESILNWLASQ